MKDYNVFVNESARLKLADAGNFNQIYDQVYFEKGCKLGCHNVIGSYDEDLSVHIGSDTVIANHVHINGEVEIGDRCSIGDNVVIESNVKIAAYTKIDAGVIIKKDCRIGFKNGFTFYVTAMEYSTIISAGCILGENVRIDYSAKIGKHCFILIMLRLVSEQFAKVGKKSTEIFFLFCMRLTMALLITTMVFCRIICIWKQVKKK